MLKTNNFPPDTPLKNGGILSNHLTIESGVQLRTSSFYYDVIFYKSDVVRVHQYVPDQSDTDPYAVIENPMEIQISIVDAEEIIALESDDVKVQINKSPIHFSFYDKDGKLINADDAGLGMECQGTQKTVYKLLQESEKFIGLGEKTGGLNRRGKGFQNWNTDAFAYGLDDDPIYASIPFYIGIHNQGTYGIFLDNTYKSYFNFGASNNRFSSFSVDAGDIDYYFFSGSVENIIRSYTWLTGRMPLPPLWSLGYQQCRYSYYPDKEVMNVAQKFRQKNIFIDVMVLDIHYMDQYKIFSWDERNFPDPRGMIKALEDIGFEVVVICDPGIKIEEGYHVYESGVSEDVFLKYPDGSCYEGKVWPGWCHFPDFTKESARNWWTKMLKSYTDLGLKGFWNDMNEIATWGNMLPENIQFSFEGKPATTRKSRNIYGFQMARSSFESAKENLKGKRPFILTRAAFAGIQRYSALWTGDNVATSDHMLLGVRLVNSLGLSGFAYTGNDIGGFCGDCDSRLFARWIQIGAFTPFFRSHSMINSKDSEPWSFGEEVEEISANYINLRYKLMPYTYSIFLYSTETGLPVARSLAIDYSHDENIYKGDYENQYLYGKSILVAPIGSHDRYLKLYLPKGRWYDFFTDKSFEGNQEIMKEYQLEELPLFVKSSAIIPVYPEVNRNTKEKGELLELHIYNGEEANTFEYYEDDGMTYDHENGVYHRRIITFDPSSKALKIGEAYGSYESSISKLKVLFHGFKANELDKIDGIKTESYVFVKPISDFDPYKDTTQGKFIDEVQTAATEYKRETMMFNW
ncbi:MAG: glycoside hydrolase family 31 protein [Bacteroidota bacterium]